MDILTLFHPLTVGIVTLLILVMVYMYLDRAEKLYKASHMGYSKDEWEAFTARNDYTPQQVQNICTHLKREWPKSEDDWFVIQEEVFLDLAEAHNSSGPEDFEAYCNLVIDGEGKGYWEPSDEDYQRVTPGRLGHWVTADTSTEEEE